MGFVVLMGLGTVFFGLICIILLTLLMGKIVGGKTPAAPVAASAAPVPAVSAAPAAPAPAGIAPEVVAAITAVLSEDPGISSHGANITSIKKIS